MSYVSNVINELVIAMVNEDTPGERRDFLVEEAAKAVAIVDDLLGSATIFGEHRGTPTWRKPPRGMAPPEHEDKEFATLSVERKTWETLMEAIEAAHRGARERQPEAAPAPAAPTPAPEAPAPVAEPQRAPAPLSDSDVFDD